MWINKFKVAIATQNSELIQELLAEIPSFENLEDAKQALYLVKEATELIEQLQDKLSAQMKHLKSHIEFLDATTVVEVSKLNIKS
ncbi:MAG: hypothetical protein U9N33_12645 [Campylobacterota bacterium]|nr:hypothetical protein [Campylobacterota bacterium]